MFALAVRHFLMATGHLSRNEQSRVIVPFKKEAEERETASDRPSIQSKIRPTRVRPVLLRRKSYIVLRARMLAQFKAHAKETTKEVARPKAAPPLYVL